MATYKIFSHKYSEQLKYELRHGIGLERLRSSSFEPEFQDENLIDAPRLEDASSLLDVFPLDAISAKDKREAKYEEDLKTAIALYERFPNLTPLQAANSDFWMTLTFRDLFPYMQIRWRDVMESDFDNIQYLVSHWLPGNRLMAHGLAGLWWSVKQSVDEEHVSDKYWLTKELFKFIEFRVYKFGSKPVFNYKPAVLGILQFMVESPVFSSGEKRGPRINYIAQLLTRWDNVKLISFRDRQYFIDELKSIEKEIEKAEDRGSVHTQVAELDY